MKKVCSKCGVERECYHDERAENHFCKPLPHDGLAMDAKNCKCLGDGISYELGGQVFCHKCNGVMSDQKIVSNPQPSDLLEDVIENIDISSSMHLEKNMGEMEIIMQLEKQATKILAQAIKEFIAGRLPSPEQLHIWYLEATSKIHNMNYNPNAHKPYAELNEEQKLIDKYISEQVKLALGIDKEVRGA